MVVLPSPVLLWRCCCRASRCGCLPSSVPVSSTFLRGRVVVGSEWLSLFDDLAVAVAADGNECFVSLVHCNRFEHFRYVDGHGNGLGGAGSHCNGCFSGAHVLLFVDVASVLQTLRLLDFTGSTTDESNNRMIPLDTLKGKECADEQVVYRDGYCDNKNVEVEGVQVVGFTGTRESYNNNIPEDDRIEGGNNVREVVMDWTSSSGGAPAADKQASCSSFVRNELIPGHERDDISSDNDDDPNGDTLDSIDVGKAMQEEKEMDDMFKGSAYPSIEEVTQAREPEDGLHFKTRDDAFFFFCTFARKVEAHGKEPLCVVCTSNPEEADEMIKKMRLKLGGMIDRIIRVDVEYTREDEPNQRAAVLQLCLEEMVLVFHITAATKMPDWFDGFLKEKMYTFVGFDITRDQEMLKKSGLEINPEKFVDMQKKWRHPYAHKPYDSLTDVADILVHPFYKHMKQTINRKEDHKLWGIAPLPDYLIQYASIDAYATYKAWTIINLVMKGFYRINYEETYGIVYDF
ncbi:hypothetical protein ZWY2020_031374 [Hordeum vulgare]|nr:hypothetical protein ZWY2020_031374 [Hordeum vulgare]